MKNVEIYTGPVCIFCDWAKALLEKKGVPFKEIYIGHTPVTRLGETVPLHYANVWNIDTGAAFKGPLSVVDVDTKEVWQSDPVYRLYPSEKGRN